MLAALGQGCSARGSKVSAERGSIGSVGEKSPLHSSWCRPKGISFARVKTRNRAFRISGFQARPPLPFHAPHPGLWWAYCDAHGSSTSPLRPKTNPSGTHRCSEKEVHGSSGARRVNVGIGRWNFSRTCIIKCQDYRELVFQQNDVLGGGKL